MVQPHNNTTATLTAASRLDALLAAIQPSPFSEFRRLTIAHYICGLIKRCFQPHHQVEAFMFGSVPLRAVLPDGDIDISVFAEASAPGDGGPGRRSAPPLRDTWASQLLRALEAEAASPDAPFRIRDVHIIQAEVKLVKCVVSDVVVDVSLDTLGGLRALAFLEAADRRIGRHHLFKRAILLLKAWCYYESRLLGAHHGLISSYALEVLVLYIFNQHGAQLHTPLDVLRRFLSVLGDFDWERYCLSLRGPVPLDALHAGCALDASAAVAGDCAPLLDDQFVSGVLRRYGVAHRPRWQQQGEGEAEGPRPGPAAVEGGGGGDEGAGGAVPLVAPSFPVKHLNIVDPLLPSNNLGRSVSKASFARVKKALALGSRTLEEALRKDPRSAVDALDHFFRNTWRSPARMTADNQTFFARLNSMRLPPAAMEAAAAASAAANFPLQLAGGGLGRPGTPPGLGLTPPSPGGSPYRLPQQAQQVPAAQAAMLQLLLADPLRQQAGQPAPPHSQQALAQQAQQAQQQLSLQQAALQQRRRQQLAQLQQQQQQAALAALQPHPAAVGPPAAAPQPAASPGVPSSAPKAERLSDGGPQEGAASPPADQQEGQAASQLPAPSSATHPAPAPQAVQQPPAEPERGGGSLVQGTGGRPAAAAVPNATGAAASPPAGAAPVASNGVESPRRQQLGALPGQGSSGQPATPSGPANAAAQLAPLLSAPPPPRLESPHSFFAGDLEAIEQNLLVACARRLRSTAAAPAPAAAAAPPAAEELAAAQGPGAAATGEAGSPPARDSPAAAASPPELPDPAPASPPAEAAAAAAVPVPEEPATPSEAAAATAAAGAEMPAGLPSLPAVRTRSPAACSSSREGEEAPPRLSWPAVQGASPQAQAQAPPPLPVAPRSGPPSDSGRSPKTFAAALLSSSRSSAAASLAASPVASGLGSGAAAAPLSSLGSSPSRSRPPSGATTPSSAAVAAPAAPGGSAPGGQRPAWGRGSSGGLGVQGAPPSPPLGGMQAAAALPAPVAPGPRSWSAVAAAGAAAGRRLG